jgi:hypothetical protein
MMDAFAYAESTFTPALSGAGTPVYTTQLGFYRRVGRRIDFDLHLVWTGATAGASLVISGLPAATTSGLNRDQSCYIGYASGITPGAGVSLMGLIPQGSSQINLQTFNNGTMAPAVHVAAGTFHISGSYQAAGY